MDNMGPCKKYRRGTVKNVYGLTVTNKEQARRWPQKSALHGHYQCDPSADLGRTGESIGGIYKFWCAKAGGQVGKGKGF